MWLFFSLLLLFFKYEFLLFLLRFQLSGIYAQATYDYDDDDSNEQHRRY